MTENCQGRVGSIYIDFFQPKSWEAKNIFLQQLEVAGRQKPFFFCILAGHVTGGLCSGVFSFMVFANGVSTLHLWCHFIYGDFGDPLAWITFRSRLWIDRYGHMPLPTDKVFVSFVRWLLEFRTPMPESKIEATGWSNNASPSHRIPGRKLNLHHFCFRWTCGICSTL